MSEMPRAARSTDARTDVPSWIALAFVLIAVVALAAVPWAGARKTQPLYTELTELLAPARGLVTRINAALALEGSLLRDYVTSRDTLLTRRYRAAYAKELQATDSLAAVVASLGENPQAALGHFRNEQQQWHARVDSLLADPVALASKDPLRGKEYEEALDAVVKLDAALETAAQRRRIEIMRLERLQGRIAIALGLLATAAAIVVGWLAKRLSVNAAMLRERGFALERAIEGRARLMRGITHDLKNPLHTIDGHAQLLEDDVLGPMMPPQRDSVKRVRRAVATMLGLIDDLLDLARAEAGQLRITPERVDAMRLVREAVEQARGMAEIAGHSIEVAPCLADLTATTDGPRVRQILGNLLSNAIKYTPRGGHIAVKASIRTRNEPPSEPWIAIEVADNGQGIPPDRQQAIFAEFTRLDEHEAIPGAGLGLSISRRIAVLLGGELTVESAPGQGAIFTLWLPSDRRGVQSRDAN